MWKKHIYTDDYGEVLDRFFSLQHLAEEQLDRASFQDLNKPQN
jgi:hypothetical protein